MSTDDGGLKGLFRDRIPEFHWQPIETGHISPGVPDANYCCVKVEGWVEFKRTKRMRIKFEEFQVPWIHRRTREGGRVHIAVRRMHDGGPRLGPPVDELWIFHGRHAIQIHDEGMSPALASGHWTGGPRAWNWAEVRAILLEP